MKIKFILPVLLALLFFACKNNQRSEGEENPPETDVHFSPTANEISRKDTVGKAQDTPPANNNQKGNKSDSAPGNATISMGRYIKTDQQSDNDCNCYCIEVNLDKTGELCLAPESMYITTRMQKGEENKINLFFVEPSSRNTEGKDIPWQEFDKNTPIATLSPQNNGEMELDWLGFSINGDLAMDYAIYGKKTLEGIYKKK